ncbi:MAG: hypothetical protein PHU85_15635 [Phycisphaerae bacterium]|nr:hypothetical protein [Phycisphaerae bacterium]
MPLRAFVKANPETLSDFLLAADDRYREAEELLLAEEYDGCVYLLGYAAEMWLKKSAITLDGGRPNAVVKDALAKLQDKMSTAVPPIAKRDWHDLSYFVECVLRLRDDAGKPLPLDFERELRQQISDGLDVDWAVAMRYRRCALKGPDAWKALGNAWWMKTNWTRLII